MSPSDKATDSFFSFCEKDYLLFLSSKLSTSQHRDDIIRYGGIELDLSNRITGDEFVSPLLKHQFLRDADKLYEISKICHSNMICGPDQFEPWENEPLVLIYYASIHLHAITSPLRMATDGGMMSVATIAHYGIKCDDKAMANHIARFLQFIHDRIRRLESNTRYPEDILMMRMIQVSISLLISFCMARNLDESMMSDVILDEPNRYSSDIHAVEIMGKLYRQVFGDSGLLMGSIHRSIRSFYDGYNSDE